jgi:hypothetical protein
MIRARREQRGLGERILINSFSALVRNMPIRNSARRKNHTFVRYAFFELIIWRLRIQPDYRFFPFCYGQPQTEKYR